MFGKKYSYTRGSSAVTAVSKFLARGAEAVASIDTSNKPMGERMEQAISELINKDPDVEFLVRRLSGRFGISVELLVVPKINDQTLMIDSYMLCTANQSNTLVPIVEHRDADTLVTYLTEIALTGDESKMKAFCVAVDKAANSK